MGISPNTGVSGTGIYGGAGISPQAGISADGAIVPYPLTFAALGLTGTQGYVYDGLASNFYTDSAMTTLCTTSGSSPVGAVEDLSGNGNHATRSVSANKPVFYESGGIKSARGGTISGVDRSLALPALGAGAAFTAYMVARVTNNGLGGGYPVILGQNGGGFYYFQHETSGDPHWRIYTPSAAGNLLLGGPGPSEPGVFIFDANARIAGNVSLRAKTPVSDGVYPQANSAYAPTPNITSASEWLSAIGASSDHLQSPFLFVAMADLVGTAAETTILNYLYDNLGSW